MDKKIVFISSHAPFNSSGEPIANTGYAIPAILQDKDIPFYCIYHSLHGGMKSFKIIFKNKKKVSKYSENVTSKNLVIKTVQEFILSYKLLNECLMDVKNIDVFIGVDPLNVLYGLIAKYFFRKKIKSIIFYTADFAENRFPNVFLNTTYHLIDTLAVKLCDSNWVVSKKIMEMRINNGEKKERVNLFPNALYLKNRRSVDINKKNRYHFVLVSTILDSISMNPLIEALGILKEKHPQITLTVVGVVELPSNVRELSEKVGMGSSITTIQYMNHEALVQLMNEAGIGISLYQQTERNPWLKYSDSMKTRDYVASGCPVIISDFLDLASEVATKTLGFQTNFVSVKDLVTSISRIVQNERTYRKYVRNCLQYAKITSPETTFFQLIKQLQ